MAKRIRLSEKTRPIRTRGKGKDGAFKVAVKTGMIPKACNAFALFFKATKDPTLAPAEQMRHAGRVWRTLDAVAKAVYDRKAAKQKAEQAGAAKNAGFKWRGLMQGDASQKGAGAHVPVGMTSGVHLGPYKVLDQEPIGEGTYGKVAVARSRAFGNLVAVKLFKDSASELARELRVYDALLGAPEDRPFLQVLDSDRHHAIPWLATRYIASGTVSRCVREGGPLPDVDFDAFSLQLGAGLCHMHSVGLLHLDVKPSNILWQPSDRRAYIIDMGTAEKFPVALDRSGSIVYYTPAYRPPELWQVPLRTLGAAQSCPDARAVYLISALTPSTDAWAAGATLYEVAVGQRLFKAEDKAELRTAILRFCNCEERRRLLLQVPLGRRSACSAGLIAESGSRRIPGGAAQRE
jgi:hypothetical protein